MKQLKTNFLKQLGAAGMAFLICLPQPMSAQTTQVLPVLKASEIFNRIGVAPEDADITGFYFPDKDVPAAGVLIHILDAHSDGLIQRKMQKVLAQLEEKRSFAALWLEGGIGPQAPQNLFLSQDAELNQKALNYLMDEGLVGGGEAYAVQTALGSGKQNPRVMGLESRAEYFENLRVFKKILIEKKEVDGWLEAFWGKTWKTISRQAGASLNDFLQAYAAGQKDPFNNFARYAPMLRSLSKEKLKIDFTDSRTQIEWPQLMRFFAMNEFEKKMKPERVEIELKAAADFLRGKGLSQDAGILSKKKITEPRIFFEELDSRARALGFRYEDFPQLSLWAGYLILRSEINAEELTSEIEALSQLILGKFTLSNKELSAVRLVREGLLLEKLLKIELSSDDWKKIQKNEILLSPSALRDLIAELNGTVLQKEKDEPAWYLDALNFYRSAEKRDRAFIENLQRSDSRSDQVIITGGYHKNALERAWRQSGRAFIQLRLRGGSYSHETRKKYYRSIIESNEIEDGASFNSEDALKNLNSINPGFRSGPQWRQAMMRARAEAGIPTSHASKPALRSEIRQEILNGAQRLFDFRRINSDVHGRIKGWAEDAYSGVHESLLERIQAAETDPAALMDLMDSFTGDIKPGTGGLRGTIGPGPNRINIYTMGKIVEATARFYKSPAYLEKAREHGVDPGKAMTVVIAYDSREGSYDPVTKGPGYFVRRAAEIYSAHGFNVQIIDEPRPTPTLSYLTYSSKLVSNVVGGAVFTASHNPKTDNGYKPYLFYGGQIPPAYVDEYNRFLIAVDSPEKVIQTDSYDDLVRRGLVSLLDADQVDEDYINAMVQDGMGIHVQKGRYELEAGGKLKPVHVVYSPTNGVSGEQAKKLFKRLGLEDAYFHKVAEDWLPDGNFPGAYNGRPNPEDPLIVQGNPIKAARELRKRLIGASDPSADEIMVLVNDPDADRLAVAEWDSQANQGQGDFVILSGHIPPLLIYDYMISQMLAEGTLPQNAAFAKTVVTSDNIARLVAYYNKTDPALAKNPIKLLQHLVGFKFSGEFYEYFSSKAYKEAVKASDPLVQGKLYRDLNLMERRQLLSRYSMVLLGAVEETVGFNMDDLVRDKDGLHAAALFAEMKMFYAKQGKTLSARLEEIYKAVGYSKEFLFNQKFERGGKAVIPEVVKSYRDHPPQKIAGKRVILVRDFRDQKAMDLAEDRVVFNSSARGVVTIFDSQSDGAEFPVYTFNHPEGVEVPFVKEDFLIYLLEDGSMIGVRPSGTEPIIKYYFIGLLDPSKSQDSALRAGLDDWVIRAKQELEAAGQRIETEFLDRAELRLDFERLPEKTAQALRFRVKQKGELFSAGAWQKLVKITNKSDGNMPAVMKISEMLDLAAELDMTRWGGKATRLAVLAQMAEGIYSVPGVAVTNDIASVSDELVESIIRQLEQVHSSRLNHEEDAAVFSIRSSPLVSMPGVLDTVINVGLTDKIVMQKKETIRLNGKDFSRRETLLMYLKLIENFGVLVNSLGSEDFEKIRLDTLQGTKEKESVPVDQLEKLVGAYQSALEQSQVPFPQKPEEQFRKIMEAVRNGWNSQKAVQTRKSQGLKDVEQGVALVIQPMKFGNFDARSGSGVFYTANPATGEEQAYGNFRLTAHGEDLVSSAKVGESLDRLRDDFPGVWQELQSAAKNLELLEGKPVELEFTVESGKLFILQYRPAFMSDAAVAARALSSLAAGSAMDLTRAAAALESRPLYRVRPDAGLIELAAAQAGMNGAFRGHVEWDVDRAKKLIESGNAVIFIIKDREHLTWEVQALIEEYAPRQRIAVLSLEGGKSSHAMITLPQLGIPVVSGLFGTDEKPLFQWDGSDKIIFGQTLVTRGDILTIEGAIAEGDRNRVFLAGKILDLEKADMFKGSLDFSPMVYWRELEAKLRGELTRSAKADADRLWKSHQQLEARQKRDDLSPPDRARLNIEQHVVHLLWQERQKLVEASPFAGGQRTSPISPRSIEFEPVETDDFVVINSKTYRVVAQAKEHRTTWYGGVELYRREAAAGDLDFVNQLPLVERDEADYAEAMRLVREVQSQYPGSTVDWRPGYRNVVHYEKHTGDNLVSAEVQLIIIVPAEPSSGGVLGQVQSSIDFERLRQVLADSGEGEFRDIAAQLLGVLEKSQSVASSSVQMQNLPPGYDAGDVSVYKTGRQVVLFEQKNGKITRLLIGFKQKPDSEDDLLSDYIEFSDKSQAELFVLDSSLNGQLSYHSEGYFVLKADSFVGRTFPSSDSPHLELHDFRLTKNGDFLLRSDAEMEDPYSGEESIWITSQGVRIKDHLIFQKYFYVFLSQRSELRVASHLTQNILRPEVSSQAALDMLALIDPRMDWADYSPALQKFAVSVRDQQDLVAPFVELSPNAQADGVEFSEQIEAAADLIQVNQHGAFDVYFLLPVGANLLAWDKALARQLNNLNSEKQMTVAGIRSKIHLVEKDQAVSQIQMLSGQSRLLLMRMDQSQSNTYSDTPVFVKDKTPAKRIDFSARHRSHSTAFYQGISLLLAGMDDPVLNQLGLSREQGRIIQQSADKFYGVLASLEKLAGAMQAILSAA